MRNIKLYIISSIDGFISPLDHDLEWLINYQIPSKEDHDLFLQSIDSVLLGGNTYRELSYMDILWPYKNKKVYIITNHPSKQRMDVSFITENVIESIAELKKQEGKDIWLVGGVTLVTTLLETDLIDKIIVTHIPLKLGNGIPLFSKNSNKKVWILESEFIYGIDTFKRTYSPIK